MNIKMTKAPGLEPIGAFETTTSDTNHTNACELNQALSNSAEAQRGRLLEALEKHAVTTLFARRNLDIMHPAARAMELRLHGHHIDTVWTKDYSQSGKPHRVAKYILRVESVV